MPHMKHTVKPKSNSTSALKKNAPALYGALCNLLEWSQGRRGPREGNPYHVREINEALDVLRQIQVCRDRHDVETDLRRLK